MKKDKISVIVPAFNVEKYIERCLDSIIKQDFEELEVIIVDDASSDNTCKIVREKYCSDSRVRLVRHNSNQGLGNARNTGLKYSKGQFVFFVDSDDWIGTNTLGSLYNIAVKEQADIVACGIRFVYDDGNYKTYHAVDLRTVGGETGLTQVLNGKISVTAWNKLYRKSLLEDNQISFPPIYHEDMTFAMEAIYHSKLFISVSDELYSYFQSPNSITRASIGRKHLESYFEIFKLHNKFISKNKLKAQGDIVKKIIRFQTNWTLYNMKKFYNQTDRPDRDTILHEVLANQFGENSYLLKELLDNLIACNQKILSLYSPKNLLKRIEGKNIIFFGTGLASRKISDNFPLDIKYYVDNNSNNWGHKLQGIEICNPEKLLSEDKEQTAIVVVSQYYSEISAQLKEMGFEENINYWNGYEIFTLGIGASRI